MTSNNVSPLSGCILLSHGNLHVITSSISGMKGAIAAPLGDASRVSHTSGRDSLIARKAGLVIKTSPILSGRTHKIFLQVCQPASLIHASAALSAYYFTLSLLSPSPSSSYTLPHYKT